MSGAMPGSAGDGLGPGARALLDAAREELSPDAAAVHRVHARIHLATAGAAAGTAIGVKLGLVALVAAVAVGAGVYVGRGPGAAAPPATAPAPARAIELASPPERPPQAAAHEAAVPPVTSEASEVSDDELITIETPLSGAAIRRTPPRPAAPAPRPAAPAPRKVEPTEGPTAGPTAGPGAGPTEAAPPRAALRAGIELGREVELVDLAMAALRRGDPGAALRAMQEYAAEAAGGGQLTEDAAAIEIEALCKLGDPAARDKLATFDARFPRSAQRSRLEATCR